MTPLEKLIQQWNGKSPIHPKGIKGQCVALYRLYLDALNVPQSPPVSGARLIWNTVDTEYFERIPKSYSVVPQPGDIVIFSAFPGNPYGHVGMCTEAYWWSFKSFDANWSVPKIARLENHNYTYVIGWLRLKGVSVITNEDIQRFFREIWHIAPATGDWRYFRVRLDTGSITGGADLKDKMLYWYGTVYPGGVFNQAGNAKWQRAKASVLG